MAGANWRRARDRPRSSLRSLVGRVRPSGVLSPGGHGGLCHGFPTINPFGPIHSHGIPCNPIHTHRAPRAGNRKNRGGVDGIVHSRSWRWSSNGQGSKRGMDRFVSTYTNKIDAKGRVSVPAPFRAILERDGYAAASTATPRSTLRRSMQAARDLRRKSTGFSMACRTIRTSATNVVSRSMVTCRSLSLDQDGRIVLPEALRAHAGYGNPRRVCRPGPEIPDVGAQALRRAPRQAREKVQGHRKPVQRGAPPP